MGDVIRSHAAVDEIFKDARAAYNAAIARGGNVKERSNRAIGTLRFRKVEDPIEISS